MVIDSKPPSQHLGRALLLGRGGCYDAAMARLLPLLRMFRLYPARLLTVPQVRVTRRSRLHSVVAIDGLVCGVCAARTRRALARLPGVAAVEVDLARGLATIYHAGIEHAGAGLSDAPPDGAALQAALDGVVVAVGLRRRLARWSARWPTRWPVRPALPGSGGVSRKAAS